MPLSKNCKGSSISLSTISLFWDRSKFQRWFAWKFGGANSQKTSTSFYRPATEFASGITISSLFQEVNNPMVNRNKRILVFITVGFSINVLKLQRENFLNIINLRCIVLEANEMTCDDIW